MKNKTLLIALLYIYFAPVCKGQSTNPPALPEGVWQLKNVEIKHIAKDGEISDKLYTSGIYANPTDCIYPVLKIEAGKCYLEKDGAEDIVTYDNDQEKLTLWYSNPVVFTYSLPSANTLSLTRAYNKYDTEKNESVALSVRLIYTKD